MSDEENLVQLAGQGPPSPTRHWKSFILRPASFSFTTLIISIIIGLAIFELYSQKNRGYPIPSHGAQALYKYLPVVGLVFIQYFWGKYELEIKKLAPWADMRKRAQWAEDSLLLDYVGANPITVAYRAVQKRHWPVLLSLIGAGLISLCLIVGTSLWEIIPIQMADRPIKLKQSQVFSTGSFKEPSSAAYLSQFISDWVFKRDPPLWLSNRDIMIPFELATPNVFVGNITGKTEAYSGQLVCEPIRAHGTGWHEHKISNRTDENEIDVMTYQVATYWRGCNQTINAKTYPKSMFYNNQSYNSDLALIITRFDEFETVESVGIVCDPIYTRHDVNVVVNASSYAFLSSYNGLTSNATLTSDEDLFYWLDHSNVVEIDKWGNEYGAWFPGWYWGDSGIADGNHMEVGAWATLLMRTHDFSKSDLTDENQLINASQFVFSRLFPYVARAGYLLNASSPIEYDGLLSTVENRLVSMDISIHIIQSALAVMVLITGALFWLHPVTNLRQDPAPLISSAMILASNPNLEDRFRDTNEMSEEQLHMHLRGTCLSTQDDGHAVTVISEGPLIKLNGLMPLGEPSWKPVFLHPVMKIFLTLILGGSIAILESLLRYSRQHEGLTNLSASRWERYSWLYTAPSILFVIGLLVNSLHLVIRATHPYNMMKLGCQSTQALFFNPLFHGPIVLIPRSLQRKMLPITFSALALVVLPAAKIFVAGIFKAGSCDTYSVRELKLKTKFGTYFNSVEAADGVNAEFAVTTLSDWGHIQIPDWTTQSLAIGSIDVKNLYSEKPVDLIVQKFPVAKTTLEDCKAVEYDMIIEDDLNSEAPYYISTNTSCSFWIASEKKDFNNANYFAYIVGIDDCLSFIFAYGSKTKGALKSVTKDHLNMTVMECEAGIITSTATIELVYGSGSVKIENVSQLNDKDNRSIPAPIGIGDSQLFSERARSPRSPILMGPTPDTDFNLFFEVMTRKYPNVSLDTYLAPEKLEDLIKEGWSIVGTLFANRALRIPLDLEDEEHDKVSAKLRYEVPCIKMNPVPARIFEGFLAVLFLLVVAVSILSPRMNALNKPPYSDGARMSMLAGTRIVQMLREAPPDQKPEDTLRGVYVKLETDGPRTGLIDIVDGLGEEEKSTVVALMKSSVAWTHGVRIGWKWLQYLSRW